METIVLSFGFPHKKVVVWIRIPKLPVELCNDRFLNRIVTTLGTMLRIDHLTSLHARGKFVRICVELDLDKPLTSHISIWGMKLCLEYEGLHSICFRCGKYGHKKDACREMLEVAQDLTVVSEDSGMILEPAVQHSVAEPVIVQDAPGNKEQANIVVVENDQEVREMGPWNIPKYITKKKKRTSSSKNSPKDNGFKQTINSPSTMEKVPLEENSTKDSTRGDVANETPEIVAGQVQNTNLPKTKPPPKPKVRNSTGGRNPQTPAKKKGQMMPNGRACTIKDGGSRHAAKNIGTDNKVSESVLKQAPGKENIASSSSSNEDKRKETGVKINAEEEAMLAYMKAINQSLGTSFITKIQGLEDGRIALAVIDENDKMRAAVIKKKLEALNANVPMDTMEGLALQNPQNSL